LDQNILGTIITMADLKNEIFEYIEKLMRDRVKVKRINELYTINEAANLLSIKISRLRQAVFRKEISYIKLGALVRFRQEDLEIYIQKNLKTYA
jgi:excisionase family DNA binding protein